MFKDFFSEKREKTVLKTVNTQKQKGLRTAAIICWIIMIAAQIIVAVKFNGKQISDSVSYLNAANDVLAKGGLYPLKSHLYDRYIFGNGYVNYIALIMKLTGSLRPVFYLNIIWTQLLLLAGYSLTKKLFPDKAVQHIFVILFSLLNTFWSETVLLRTELIFTALCYLALALMYSDKKFKCVLAGILIALANWIRPLGVVFLIGAIFVLIYKQEKFKKFCTLVISYVCVICIIGSVTYFNCGKFIYQATTSGVNLMMTANDEADGSYNPVFEKGQAGYIPEEESAKMMYSDYNDYYIKKSVDWIIKNPKKYISQMPKKIFLLFATETYSSSAFFNNEVSTAGKDYIKDVAGRVRNFSNVRFADLLVIFNQLWYMAIVLFFAIGVIMLLAKKMWRRCLPFAVILLGGTAITAILVTGARYHFPYLPLFMIIASFAVSRMFFGKEKSRSKK